MRAGLEGAIQRGATRARSGLFEREHLGVRPARDSMRAAPDNHATGVDDESADERVGTRRPPPALRKRQGFAHEVVVIHVRIGNADCRVQNGD
jgi:hypothetical protein